MTTSITIVGVGALGSHLVQLLRNEDVLLHVVDFDRVEAKNLGSQFHGLPGRSRLKVDALKAMTQYLWGQRLLTSPVKLTRNNVVQLLGKAQLLVDCLDNLEARALTQNFAKAQGIPCVHGALAPDGSFGRVVWTDAFTIDPEGAPGQPTCENGEFLPFIALTAAHLALAIQEYLRHKRQVGYQIAPGATFRV